MSQIFSFMPGSEKSSQKAVHQPNFADFSKFSEEVSRCSHWSDVRITELTFEQHKPTFNTWHDIFLTEAGNNVVWDWDQINSIFLEHSYCIHTIVNELWTVRMRTLKSFWWHFTVSVQMLTLVKGLVHTKIKILSLFTHPNVVPNTFIQFNKSSQIEATLITDQIQFHNRNKPKCDTCNSFLYIYICLCYELKSAFLIA